MRRPGRSSAGPPADNPGGGVVPYELPERVAELAGALSEEQSESRRRRLALRLPRLAGRGGKSAWTGVQSGGRWLTTQVLEMAPRLPVRSADTLRRQFPGRSPEEIADLLIEGAARAAAGVGAAVGASAVLPFPPAAPVEIGVETLAVVGIELKLVAELHEVYGMRAAGSGTDRMMAYVDAWAHRRGIGLAPGGLVLAVGSPLRRRLERRLLARAGRSATSLGPLLTGAAAGALLNRRETRKLGHEIRDDLRRRSPDAGRWPGPPAGWVPQSGPAPYGPAPYGPVPPGQVPPGAPPYGQLPSGPLPSGPPPSGPPPSGPPPSGPPPSGPPPSGPPPSGPPPSGPPPTGGPARR
jgi:hypothetical protein